MHLIAEDILTFWFGTTDLSTVMERRQVWFRSTPEFDATLRERYTVSHERATVGAFDGFVKTREECLALVLALDQFPRNIFRGTRRAFASDAKAREIARIALNRGYDEGICPAFRVFFYLPFEHSENVADQDRALELYKGLGEERSLTSDTPAPSPCVHRHRESRIEVGKIIGMPRGQALVEAEKVDINQLVNRPAVQQPKHLRQRQRCRYRAHERSTHRLAGEQCHTAAIENTVLHELGICGAVLDLFSFAWLLPDIGGGAPAGQDVKAHGAEITMSAAETGFYDKVKTNLIQRPSTCSIVEPAKRNRRFVRLPREIRGENPLLERSREAAPFSPSCHRPCLFFADHGGVGEDGGALRRLSYNVDILQDQRHFSGVLIRQQAETP